MTNQIETLLSASKQVVSHPINPESSKTAMPLIELQDELGDMIHALALIPRLLRYVGEHDSGNRGLDANECDMLGTILACYTDEVERRYVGLIDKAHN